jgi:hypothetical protein
MEKQGSGARKAGVRGQGSEKTQDSPLITAPAVRAFLAETAGAWASAPQVEERLQVQTRKDRNRVRDILAALVRSGQAEIVMDEDRDEVRYALCLRPNARGAVQARLWRFACHRFQTARPFTAAEAAGMASSDLDYAKRYCRWLWNSGYLAIVSRGRANAMLYQVVGGKEHEAAPAWNRRAEKRKGGGQGSGVRGQEETPPEPRTQNPEPAVRRLDEALEDFGRALVDITGSIGRAWEIIREMKGELLAIGETCHDEPIEPTEGHH